MAELAFEIQTPQLADLEAWRFRLEIVLMLCQIGTITGDVKNDSYPKFPCSYNVKGIAIRFLPHWGFIEIQGVNQKIPNTIEKVRELINLEIRKNELYMFD